MTIDDDRADMLVAFGRWAEWREEERKARRQAAWRLRSHYEH